MPEIRLNAKDKARWQRELKPASRKDIPGFLMRVQPQASEFMGYMLPHLKRIKKLEKSERKSRGGGTKADTDEYLRAMMGRCPEGFREKVCFVSDWGTVVEEVSIKAEEVKLAVEEEKHRASSKAKLPVALAGLAALAVCAVCSVFGVSLAGLFGTVGMAVLIGVWLGAGIAGLAVDRAFSKRERAIAVWEKASSRVGIPPRGEETMGEPRKADDASGEWLLPGQEN